jgi:hypothetical protein
VGLSKNSFFCNATNVPTGRLFKSRAFTSHTLLLLDDDDNDDVQIMGVRELRLR